MAGVLAACPPCDWVEGAESRGPAGRMGRQHPALRPPAAWEKVPALSDAEWIVASCGAGVVLRVSFSVFCLFWQGVSIQN